MLLWMRETGAGTVKSVISKNQIPGCRNHEQHIYRYFFRALNSAARSIPPSPLPFKEGSLSLEAAVLIPIFLSVVIALLSFMNLIAVQVAVDRALSETGRQIAMYGGVKEQIIETPENEDRITAYLQKTLLNAAFSELLVRSLTYDRLKDSAVSSGAVAGGVSGISFAGSSYDAKSGRIVIQASYRVRLAYFPSFSGIRITQKSVHRLWNGRMEESTEAAENTEEECVYVTENGTVYHRSLSCPSLSLKISETTPREIVGLRSLDGSIFYPCEYCGSVTAATLYYTPYGDRYHTERNCSRLKRTIREIPLSEAAGLPACKRCGGNHE